MVSATELADNLAVRVMIVGYPGSGKTGALCCLADAGFKIRVIDFDGNYDPLLKFTSEGGLHNIDIVTLEDKMRGGPKCVETSGIPTAFAEGLRMAKHWKYKHPVTGDEVDLGATKDWGRDHILVVDSGTGCGRAAFRRTVAINNRTPMNTRDSDWGLAMGDQDKFMEMLTSTENRFHVIVNFHLKIIGPRDVRKGDSDLTKELKEQVAQLVPHRLFPSALGHALPQTIAEHFPTVLLAESECRQGKVKRKLITLPRPELDLKVPAPEMPAILPLETGLLTVFEALTGGVEKCLLTTKTS